MLSEQPHPSVHGRCTRPKRDVAVTEVRSAARQLRASGDRQVSGRFSFHAGCRSCATLKAHHDLYYSRRYSMAVMTSAFAYCRHISRGINMQFKSDFSHASKRAPWRWPHLRSIMIGKHCLQAQMLGRDVRTCCACGWDPVSARTTGCAHQRVSMQWCFNLQDVNTLPWFFHNSFPLALQWFQ